MKNLLLAMLLFCSLTVVAQNYNASQESLRKEISEYLSRKRYSPENQSDGLKFKIEGENFYVEIDPEEKKPMFLRVCRYIKFDEKLTRKDVLDNLVLYNSIYGVKVSCKEKNVLISFEMFVNKASEITDIFDDMMIKIKLVSLMISD